MIYKATLAHTKCLLCAELENVDDIDRLSVEEEEGTIPDEWTNEWWLNKLEKGFPSKEIIDFMRPAEEEEENLYG